MAAPYSAKPAAPRHWQASKLGSVYLGSAGGSIELGQCQPAGADEGITRTIARLLFAFARACCIGLAMSAMAGKKTAPVDKLMHVTAYPKAKATRTATTLSELVPAGTPLVIHLYTG